MAGMGGEGEEGLGEVLDAGKTERGRQKWGWEGHSYVFSKRLVDATQSWVCDQRMSCSCKGRIRLDGRRVLSSSAHTHPPVPLRPEAQRRRSEVVVAAAGSFTATDALVGGASAGMPAEVMGREAFGRRIRRARAREIPPQPDSMAHLEEIPDAFAKYPNGDNWLIANEEEDGQRILLFGSPLSLDLLGRASHLFSDGTFKAAPGICHQVYSIHSLICGVMLPLVVALLPGKSEAIYRRLFQMVKGVCPAMEPQSWMIDLERAALNAVEEVWGLRAYLCNFHWSQCLYRRIQDSGLAGLYVQDAGLCLDFRRLFSLAFTPIPDLVQRWEELSGDVDERLEPVLDYVEKNFIGELRRRRRRKPDWDPVLWSQRARTLEGLPRTSNALEGWHNRMNQSIEAHPNIFKLIRHLRQEWDKVRLRYEEAVAGNLPPKNAKWEKRSARIATLTRCYPALGAPPGPGHTYAEWTKGIAANYAE